MTTSAIRRPDKAKPGDERAAALRLKNNRLGMTIFQISWIMAFIALAVVNWQLRFSYGQWPPLGVAPFDPLLPTVATLALLLSGALVMRGWRALRGGEPGRFRARWRGALGLGALFLLLVVYEFFTVSEAALATQYGITLRLMTSFHFVHALAISLLLLRVYRQAGRGKAGAWAVEGSAKLWYFVIIAWLLFYVVLYWIR